MGRSLIGSFISVLIKLSLAGFLFVLLVAYVGSKSTPNARPTAVAPAATPGTTHLTVGDLGILELPGGAGVWLATTDADWNDLIDAENAGASGGPGAGSAIYRMAESGRARKYPNGTKVRIAKVSLLSKFVEVIEGDDRGHSGWVQSEFVRASQ